MRISGLNNNLYINKTDGSKGQNLNYSSVKNSSSDIFTLQKSKITVRKKYETIKSQQGVIGKLWDGFKNLSGMKSGSKHIENVLKKYEKGEISIEEAEEALKKYEEGQKMCVDAAADVASGILAIGAFALAVPAGGASIAVGLSAATILGAGTKIAVKAGDAFTAGKEYKAKDLLYDTATGAVNGLTGPVTNGLGNCAAKTIGKKLGLKIIDGGAEQIAKQGIKSVLLNQSIDVAGGTVFRRALALGSGMALDGAVSGASDNMVRAALNGDDIVKSGVQGAIGGIITAPLIGGGFRIASKAGKALNNKITTKILLPDGLNTKFRQGQTGDCAFLSTLDGLMNNTKSANLIKNSITKTPFGDYNVKIGDTTVRVAKSGLSDEILSDTAGIRIFEQAYKQLTGDIDGGFADIAAKQFGLNPVHITSGGISDEILDKIAKEQDGTVLSLGALVDSDGFISPAGTQRHYFTIKNVDAKNKIVKITSPVDTSKTIELSYDEVKRFGISIDGGSINKTDLPDIARSVDDIEFKGVDVSSTKSKLLQDIDYSEDELLKLFAVNGIENYSPEKLASILDLYNIKPSEFTNLINKISQDCACPVKGDDAAFIFQEAIKGLELYSTIRENPIIGAFHLSLDETYNLYNAVINRSCDDIYKILEKNNPVLAKAYRENLTASGQDIIGRYLENLYNQFTAPVITEAIKPENIADIGVINGRRKRVIFPDAATVHNIKTQADPEDLIKSNMITTDLIEICSGMDIPKTYKMNIKLPKTDKFKVIINPSELIDRVKKFGIDSLSSNEVHALTDMFSDLYKTNPKFTKAVNKFVKNSKNVSQIYSYIAHLKTLAAKELSDGTVQIEDHAFMRMLDRNLLTVTDNKTLRVLSFEEFIKLLKENVLNNTNEISGYNGSKTIKMIVKPNGAGKYIIDSIM